MAAVLRSSRRHQRHEHDRVITAPRCRNDAPYRSPVRWRNTPHPGGAIRGRMITALCSCHRRERSPGRQRAGKNAASFDSRPSGVMVSMRHVFNVFEGSLTTRVVPARRCSVGHHLDGRASPRHVRPDGQHDSCSCPSLRDASAKRPGAHRGRWVQRRPRQRRTLCAGDGFVPPGREHDHGAPRAHRHGASDERVRLSEDTTAAARRWQARSSTIGDRPSAPPEGSSRRGADTAILLGTGWSGDRRLWHARHPISRRAITTRCPARFARPAPMSRAAVTCSQRCSHDGTVLFAGQSPARRPCPRAFSPAA
jgi:hypothetical protein